MAKRNEKDQKQTIVYKIQHRKHKTIKQDEPQQILVLNTCALEGEADSVLNMAPIMLLV